MLRQSDEKDYNVCTNLLEFKMPLRKPRKTLDRRSSEGCAASHSLNWCFFLLDELAWIVEQAMEKEKDDEKKWDRLIESLSSRVISWGNLVY